MTFVIDKRLDKVAITALVGFVISCFGFIHSASLGFYPSSQFAIAYLLIAILAFIFHAGRKSWFKAVEDSEYV